VTPWVQRLAETGNLVVASQPSEEVVFLVAGSVSHSKIERIVSRQLDSGRQHSYVFSAASDR